MKQPLSKLHVDFILLPYHPDHVRRIIMKLALFFLAMDVLTLLSYPFLYVYGKLHQWTSLIKARVMQAKTL